MATNNNNNLNPNDANAFFDEDTNSGFKFKDLVFLIFRNLPYFIICALIGGIIAYYYVRKQERVYSSTASLMIKTSASGGSESFRGSAPINTISGAGLVISTVNNEIMVMKSQTNMENMARKLNLNTTYSYKTKVSRRNTVLYKDGPVEVLFPEMDEEASASFSLKVLDNENVLLDDFGGGIPSQKVKVNDTIISPVGKLVIRPTWKYADFIGQEINVRHVPLSSIAASYRGQIGIRRDNDRNAILRLSIRDTSPTRAADVLNALMDAYNEESIADQQRVLDYTEKFINDRIEYLMNDIDEYEQVSVSFKKSHNIIDTKVFGQAYVAASAAKTEEAKRLDAQAEMVRYLLNFVKNNQDQMIPVGVVNVSADAAAVMTKYNNNLVKIEKYKSDGTINNPVAQSLLEEQISLHTNIITVLETNLRTLEDRIADANREKNIANSQIQTVPTAQLELNSVERMQGIKERLYLQLLTKREELLMTSPQLEATGKVIDYAHSNPNPVAPNESRVILIGVLIGLAIPILVLVLAKMLDTTIHDRIDVQKSSSVPFL